MKKKAVEIGDVYVTPQGSLCRFEYFEDELSQKEFLDRVRHSNDFFLDEQVFKIEINCMFVNEYVENHPLFPLMVWDDDEIMFGFNPRFVSKRLGW
mgnify:CR=1 FL=1